MGTKRRSKKEKRDVFIKYQSKMNLSVCTYIFVFNNKYALFYFTYI